MIFIINEICDFKVFIYWCILCFELDWDILLYEVYVCIIFYVCYIKYDIESVDVLMCLIKFVLNM